MFRQLVDTLAKPTFIKATLNAASASASATTTAATKSRAAAPVSITIYHNQNSVASLQLLNKLASFSVVPCTKHKHEDTLKGHGDLSASAKSNGSGSIRKNQRAKNLSSAKFDIDIRSNEQLTKQDYDFIMEHCLDIHPDNHSIMLQLLCNCGSSKKKLLKDFNLHEQLYNYDNIINKNKSRRSAHADVDVDDSRSLPLIIDYQNKLLANDDASFDRIMANYLSCGIQSVDRRSKSGLGCSGGQSTPSGEVLAPA
ncbi:uncharacterized protein LODBEIA_P61150 [Lodderomyces beijingensis]|uniref:Uncharacterized protein n=1 Tax=Lodderomyces beijingensis TaxID=1775926 RepID=A0ABP0ZUS5_9ASCO